MPERDGGWSRQVVYVPCAKAGCDDWTVEAGILSGVGIREIVCQITLVSCNRHSLENKQILISR